MPNVPVKRTLADLAVLGGPALFPDPVYVGRPNIGDRGRLRARLDAMLDRRWLTNDGPLVQEFEARLAARLGVRHCVATCNATAALALAVRALGMRGEVLVPSFTFAATAHVLTWAGIRPVFCDIDPRTHLLDLANLPALITPRTSGLLAVHLWGRPCDADVLAGFARARGLALLFDAAHALGGRSAGRSIGGSGHVEVLSFHATKIANAFEGGAVATDDGEVADRIRAWRNFGFVGQDYAETLGINAKMSEASAAMGLTSLESLDDFMAVNRRHYARYAEGLAGCPGIELPPPAAVADTNHHYVVAEIDAAAGLGRDALLQVLTAEGVHARRYFHPGCHHLPPYAAGDSPELPVTDAVAGRVVQLPTGSAVSDDDVARVIGLVRFVLERAGAVQAALRREAPALP